MGKYSRLGKNTVLVFVGNIGSKLISLFMLPFFTAWLSVEDYGTTDLISVYVSFLLSIITCCIAESIFIFPKGQSRENKKRYFSSGLIFSIISFSVFALIFYIVQNALERAAFSSIFTKYAWFIYGMIAASFIQSYIQQFTRSIDKITIYAVSGIVLTAVTALSSFILVPLYGIDGYIYAQIISLLFTALFSGIYSKAYEFLSVKAIKKEACYEMLKYSIPLIPNGIMWWLVSALNRPVMEHYSGMHDIGLFAVANKFPSLIVMAFSIFSYSWQISVIEEFNTKGYKEFYNKMLRIVITFLTLLSCGIAILSKTFVTIMADDKFAEAWKFIPILCFGVIFSSLSTFVGTNFSATRESKYYFYSSIWGAVASVVLNILLIPEFGIFGASLAVVIAYMVMAASRIIFSWKYVQITNIRPYFYMLLINLFLIAALLLVDDYLTRSIIILILIVTFIGINKDLYPDLKAIYCKLLKSKNQ